MRFVEGRVELDGRELPIWDDRKMNAYRFTDVSIIPQYALSALNPTRKIGTLATELLAARNIPLDEVWQEFKRRLKLVGLSEDVLDRFPIELSGGMRQRVVMVLSSLLDPSLLIADEVTSALDVSTQRAVSELLVEFRDRGFVRSMIVITHDLVRPVSYRGHDSRHVRGQAGGEGPGGDDRSMHRRIRIPSSCSPRSRRSVSATRRSAERHSRPSTVPPRASEWLPFPDPCPFAYEQCAEEPPFAAVAPDHAAACWKASLMLALDMCCKTYRMVSSAAGSSRRFGT